MKIAKAAAGVVGVAMALGAAAPAVAAPEPLSAANQLLGPDAPGKGGLKTPVKDVDVNGLVGTVDKTTKTLKTGEVTGATTQLGGAGAH
ncbi:hypothetical protein [Streptomyces sp. NPDC059063]|uniref:hypothetical protein n=1 Tax=unclassified Streptomyces TaxID=2593676 RepID=UPI00369E4648